MHFESYYKHSWGFVGASLISSLRDGGAFLRDLVYPEWESISLTNCYKWLKIIEAIIKSFSLNFCQPTIIENIDQGANTDFL